MKTITIQEASELTFLGEYIDDAITSKELTLQANGQLSYTEVEAWFWSWK